MKTGGKIKLGGTSRRLFVYRPEGFRSRDVSAVLARVGKESSGSFSLSGYSIPCPFAVFAARERVWRGVRISGARCEDSCA
jgi:hypothetical protein